jgi:hypothetical protein
MQKKIDIKSMLLGSALAAAVMLSVAAATTNREADRSSATASEKVTGIGGVFFKAREPKQMAAWCRDHLGIQSNGGFAIFNWRDKDNPERMGLTTWALFPTNTAYLLLVLQKTHWKIKGADGAAALLGVKPTTLLSRVKKMRLKRPA